LWSSLIFLFFISLNGIWGNTPEFIGVGGKVTSLSAILSNIEEINALPINSIVTNEFVNLPNASEQDKKNKANEVWNKLTDEEKKDPNGDKLKELIDNGSIGIKIIKTVEKDFVRFTDVDWIKKNDYHFIMKIINSSKEDLLKYKLNIIK
jgi:hypothetical protein